MNFLILSNNAPDYYRFFNKLADKISDDGHKVFYAVDSAYSSELNKIPDTRFQAYLFSRFWESSDRSAIVSNAKRFHGSSLNLMHVPDYERASAFKFSANRHDCYYDDLILALIAFFEHVIVKENIDVVLYENVSNTFAYAAWFVAKAMGIRYVGLYVSRLPGRFEIVDDPLNESSIYKPSYDLIRSGEAVVPADVRAWARSYIDNIESVIPDYMKFNLLKKSNSIASYITMERFRKLAVGFRRRKDNHEFSFQVGNPLRLSLQMVLRSVLRTRRMANCKKHFEKPMDGDKYFLYPLHYHPESSTSVKAPLCIDELSVIRNLAFSLPFGYRLYVKDHPSAFALPRTDFYRQVADLPNVKFISPTENTKLLIKRSEAIITLTSTVGYEGVLLNKRVFLLGSDAYEFHPNVIRLSDPQEYHTLLSYWINQPLVNDPSVNEDLIAAYYMNTHAGILNFFESDDKLDILAPKVLKAIFDVLRGQKNGREEDGGRLG